MRKNKGFAEVVLIILIGFIVCMAILSFSYEKTAQCSEFSNYSIKDVPIRCLEYFKSK